MWNAIGMAGGVEKRLGIHVNLFNVLQCTKGNRVPSKGNRVPSKIVPTGKRDRARLFGICTPGTDRIYERARALLEDE